MSKKKDIPKTETKTETGNNKPIEAIIIPAEEIASRHVTQSAHQDGSFDFIHGDPKGIGSGASGCSMYGH